MLKTLQIFLIAAIFSIFTVVHSATSAQANEQIDTVAVGHLRLIDHLDRPEDGYCLDILGVGRTLRLELPVFAHNCKPGLTTDSAITMTDIGEIIFVAVDACVTAFGVNGRSLPGSPIILSRCGAAIPYFDAGPLQLFDWTPEYKLQLRGTNLCLAVGDTGATTYSLADRWRTLSMETCDTLPKTRGSWEFVKLN